MIKKKKKLKYLYLKYQDRGKNEKGAILKEIMAKNFRN